MNGKLIVAVLVVLVLGYVVSRSSDPTPDILAGDYATTIATVATVAAYESLSSPKEEIPDSVATEVVQEFTEQMKLLSESQEPVVQESVTIPVSQVVETEVPFDVDVPVEDLLDDTENTAWKKLNDMRESAGLKRLTFAADLLNGCRTHADRQRNRKALWHDKGREAGTGENCAVSKYVDGELPIGQWYESTDHRRFMLSRSIEEGAIGRSGTYWVFRARVSKPATKTVTIVKDTGDAKALDGDEVAVKVKSHSVQNSCTGNSCTTGYASDGQRTVKTYSRTGKHRPLRYMLWRAFN
jgi:uncharacterized protein YkwD